MKNRKSYYSLLLALVLCLCLTACGGSDDTIDDGGEDYSGNEVNTPDSFEGMVKDSELATNYAMYWGTWVDADNNSELIVAMADSGDEVRFDLYQDGSIEASGFVQFSQEYSGDYFYTTAGWPTTARCRSKASAALRRTPPPATWTRRIQAMPTPTFPRWRVCGIWTAT